MRKFRKKDQDKNAAHATQNVQQKNISEINFKTFRKYPSEEFGYDVYWSEHERVYAIFLDKHIYHFDSNTMRSLTKKLDDLFFNFLIDQNIKNAKKKHNKKQIEYFGDY